MKSKSKLKSKLSERQREAMKAPPSDAALRAIEAYKAKKMDRASPRTGEDQLVLREADLEEFRQAEIEAARSTGGAGLPSNDVGRD